MIAADTDVLIDYLAGREPASGALARSISTGSLATTAVNRFELLAGARTVRQQRSIRILLDAITVWPLDSEAADRAAEVRRGLEKGGVPVGMADSLIAGIVMVRGGTLCTRNDHHFSRIGALELVAPADV